MRRLLPAALLCLLWAGCASAPPKPAWVPADGTYKAEKSGFTVDLPAGWTRLNRENGLLLTRDGLQLQVIGAARYKVGEASPLKNTKKRFEKGMLPQEIAGVLIDDLASGNGVVSCEVLENVPARLGGIEGFRVVCRLRLKDGMERKCAFYGGLRGDWVYDVYYTAAARHYFARDLETFEKVARSLRFQGPS